MGEDCQQDRCEMCGNAVSDDLTWVAHGGMRACADSRACRLRACKHPAGPDIEDLERAERGLREAEDAFLDLEGDLSLVRSEVTRARSGLVAELDRLRAENERLEALNEEWQGASGLLSSAGDPDGVTPAHLAAFDWPSKLDGAEAALDVLRAQLAKYEAALRTLAPLAEAAWRWTQAASDSGFAEVGAWQDAVHERADAARREDVERALAALDPGDDQDAQRGTITSVSRPAYDASHLPDAEDVMDEDAEERTDG